VEKETNWPLASHTAQNTERHLTRRLLSSSSAKRIAVWRSTGSRSSGNEPSDVPGCRVTTTSSQLAWQ
jgi:hypothetical protein